MSDKLADKLPQPTPGDHAHLVVKAAISAIPYVGGPVAELFNVVIQPPLVKRREEWMENIATSLGLLEGKVAGFSIAELSKNEAFITAVMHASTTAIKNHHKEKLEALRNAVLHSALPNPPESDIQLMFLGWVDALTPLHLRILALLNDPTAWGQLHAVQWPAWMTAGISSVIEHAFPELKGRRDLYDKVGKDLHNEGLLGPASFHTTTSGRGLFAPQTTRLGQQFLAFIAPPKIGG